MSTKRKQGELESEVLGCLWDRPAGLSSQQILALIGDDSIKVTTILTVLSRLEDKGLITKSAGPGRGFIFRARTTREQHTAKALVDLVGQTGNPAAVFSHFASGLTASQLRELRAALDK